MSNDRGNWASKFGFIMAAAGSSVGLGNIWRFPYLTGQNGGGAFVLVYVVCIILIGVPVLMNEMALGRLTGKNAIGAFADTGANLFWKFFGGVLAVMVSFFVLSYYTVIAGWTIGYLYDLLTEHHVAFTTFTGTASLVIPLFAFAMITSVIIVMGGISGGIEKATKIMMPVLFVLLLLTILRSLTLPGAGEGVSYYLIPDFTKINGNVILQALTQAFFSLGIGWGIMITYGSYIKKDQSIVSSSLWVAFMDTGIALLAGLMIFPAVFAFHMKPDQGFTLVFEVLANIFPQMPFGNIIGAIFFLLLFIAAITSTISMVEVVGSWLIDNKKWTRKKATWTVGIVAFVVGIPSALSKGSVAYFTDLTIFNQTSVLNIMDYVFGTVSMLIVVLTTCLYTGWIFKTDKIAEEISLGSSSFSKPLFGTRLSPYTIWMFFIRFVCPLVCGVVMLRVFEII